MSADHRNTPRSVQPSPAKVWIVGLGGQFSIANLSWWGTARSSAATSIHGSSASTVSGQPLWATHGRWARSIACGVAMRPNQRLVEPPNHRPRDAIGLRYGTPACSISKLSASAAWSCSSPPASRTITRRPIPSSRHASVRPAAPTADHADVGFECVVGGDVLGPKDRHPLHVEAELHHVAVAGDVVLALEADLAELLGLGPRADVEQLVPVDDLGPDEAALEVGVDAPGALRARWSRLVERPGPATPCRRW